MMNQHAVALHEAALAGTALPAPVGPVDGVTLDIVSEVLARCPAGAPRSVACAPARHDILGGIAEYTGGLVLALPSGDCAAAAVQRRDDQCLVIRLVGAACGEPADIALPAAAVQRADGAVVEPAEGRKLVSADRSTAPRAVLGAAAELLRRHRTADLAGGWTIVAGASVSPKASAGQSGALCAAVVAALAHALHMRADALECGDVCRRVANHWLDMPADASDALCALSARAGSISQIKCDPLAIDAGAAVPDDLAIVGIDCAAVHADACEKYLQVRTAAMMGRVILDRIIRHEPKLHPHWNGQLAHVSMTDYVKHFRDRIPTKIKGRDFLSRFGETGDPLTRIEPDHVYKVRSRTEHHIYENERSRHFVECLARAKRLARPDLYAEAGELMYASHWSYGQRCGLGSIETDLLVNLIKEHGREGKVYGAKVSGRGCGGTVVVMMRTTPQARAALEAAVEDYVTRTKLPARIIEGSLPGALVAGVRTI